MSMLAQAQDKTRKKQDSSGGGGGGGLTSVGGGGGGSTPAGLADEARRRYLNYALSVITSRALPDVRDGLKPVQRRILYAMWNDLHLRPDAKYQKCAPGRRRRHGQATTRTATPRSTTRWCAWRRTSRCAPAGRRPRQLRLARRRRAPRRTATPSAGCSRSPTSCSSELGQKTVDFRPNYDGTPSEPVVLPRASRTCWSTAPRASRSAWRRTSRRTTSARWSTRCVALIDDRDARRRKDLLKHIKGPDFPTGGQILNSKNELRRDLRDGPGLAPRCAASGSSRSKKRGGQHDRHHLDPVRGEQVARWSRRSAR